MCHSAGTDIENNLHFLTVENKYRIVLHDLRTFTILGV